MQQWTWKSLFEKAMEEGLFKKETLIELLEAKKKVNEEEFAKGMGTITEKPDDVPEYIEHNPQSVTAEPHKPAKPELIEDNDTNDF